MPFLWRHTSLLRDGSVRLDGGGLTTPPHPQFLTLIEVSKEHLAGEKPAFVIIFGILPLCRGLSA